jgi:NAD(P)-dependent dehydrogenase (short-subunit alcohol dehydrogenase family)
MDDMTELGSLQGKVAIVTGAGRGIGRAIAEQLAADGAKVVVNDLGGALIGGGTDVGPADEVAAGIRAMGGDAAANRGDVSDWVDARGLVDQAVETFGGLDIVVNNAGVIRTGMSFNTTESDWDVVIDVHLKGTFAVSRFAGEYWREQAKAAGTGVDAAIVNTTSPNGLNGGSPGHVNYAAAKSGIATMTITMARELAPYGVRCNAIAPVAFTRMTEELWGSGAFVDDNREAFSPQAMAGVVGWLASPRSSDVNGQIVGINGTSVSLWESWQTVSSVETDDRRWTIAGFDAAAEALFAGRDRGIPSFGGGS